MCPGLVSTALRRACQAFVAPARSRWFSAQFRHEGEGRSWKLALVLLSPYCRVDFTI
jgi:hypothetical protein